MKRPDAGDVEALAVAAFGRWERDGAIDRFRRHGIDPAEREPRR